MAGHRKTMPFFVEQLIGEQDGVDDLNDSVGLLDVRDSEVGDVALFVLDDDVFFAIHHQRERATADWF